MRVLHCPVVIADNAPVISKYLRQLGVDSRVVSYFRTWLDYEADVNLDLDKIATPQDRQIKLQEFVDDFFEREAASVDIVNFWFMDSLSTGNSFGGWRSHSDRPDFWDLEKLKSMGKKIVMSVVGSDVRNNSKALYWQLRFLHPDLTDLPKPPLCSLTRYQIIHKVAQYADAIVCADSETMRHVPYSMEILFPIDLEPLDRLRDAPEDYAKPSIVHAPSNSVLKGTDLIMPTLERLAKEQDMELRLIQGIPHKKALLKYFGQGVAVDQINMGFGLFALEAMYLGRQVVCSVRPGEFLPDDPKLSAPVWSVESLQDLDEIWGRDEHSFQDMREYVIEKHSAPIIAKQYKDLYDRLMAGERPLMHVSQEWMREAATLKAGEAHPYYERAGNLWLARHDVERLKFEIAMGQGMINTVRSLAKVAVALALSGHQDEAQALEGANKAALGMEGYQAAKAEAQEIWEKG